MWKQVAQDKVPPPGLHPPYVSSLLGLDLGVVVAGDQGKSLLMPGVVPKSMGARS